MKEFFQRIENKIRKHPFVFSLLVNIFFFGLTYLLAHPYFRTNDDVGMLLRVSGTSTVVKATPYIFSNIIIGKLLVFLYKVMGNIPWYGIHLIFTLFSAHVALFYTAIKKKNTPLILTGIYIIYCVFLGADIILGLQFTIVSSFACFSGLFLILTTSKQPFSPSMEIILGSVLIIYGSLIRWNTVYLYLVLFSFIIFYTVQTSQSKIQMKQKFILLFFITSLCFLFHQFNTYVYQTDPGWKKHLAFNEIRTHFTDNHIGERVAQEKRIQILTSENWSNNDYEMLKSWFFVDETVYSMDKMKSLLQKFPATTQNSVKENLKRFIDTVLTNTFALKTFALCFLMLFFIHWNKNIVLQTTGTLLILIVIFGYLVGFKRIPPPRLFIPMFSFYFFSLLIFANKDFTKGKWVLVIPLTLLTFFSVFYHKRITHPYSYAKSENTKQEEFKTYVTDQIQPNNETLYVRWGGSFSWAKVKPLGNIHFLKSFHEFGLGSAQRNPDSQKILDHFNIKNIYLDLLNKDNILLITYNQPRHKMILTQYIHEHYQIPITFKDRLVNDRYIITKPIVLEKEL